MYSVPSILLNSLFSRRFPTFINGSHKVAALRPDINATMNVSIPEEELIPTITVAIVVANIIIIKTIIITDLTRLANFLAQLSAVFRAVLRSLPIDRLISDRLEISFCEAVSLSCFARSALDICLSLLL